MKTGDVLDSWKAKEKHVAHSNCAFCPISGTYYWQADPDKNGISSRLESYTGKDDVVKLGLYVFGFIKDNFSQRENMPDKIAFLVDEIRVLERDPAKQSQFAKSLKERLTKVAYSTHGTFIDINQHYFTDDCLIFNNIHVHMQGYTRDATGELSVAATAVESRTWTDKTGKFQVVASYLSHDLAAIKLQKQDGSAISVPLTKLSAEDIKWISTCGAAAVEGLSTTKWLSKTANAKPAEGRGRVNAKSATQAKWGNTSYNNTLTQIGAKQWVEVENGTRHVNWHFTEVARNQRFVELRRKEAKPNGLIDYRVYPDHMDVKKHGKWEWVSNGRWEVEPEYAGNTKE